MKKLIFVFVALFTITLVTGCGARQNTVRFNNDTETSDPSSEKPDDTDEIVGESEDTQEDINGENEEEPLSEEIIGDLESDEMDEEAGEEIKKTVTKPAITPTGQLAVTSFDGGYLKTKLSYNVVKGTAPSNTSRITINGYKLQKYLAGQTQWDYIASTRFSSLEAGTNNYVVKAFDKSDKEIANIMFSIEYEAPALPNELPNVGGNLWYAFLLSLILGGSYAAFRKIRFL